MTTEVTRIFDCGCIYGRCYMPLGEYLAAPCKAHATLDERREERSRMATRLMPLNPRKQARVTPRGKYAWSPNIDRHITKLNRRLNDTN